MNSQMEQGQKPSGEERSACVGVFGFVLCVSACRAACRPRPTQNVRSQGISARYDSPVSPTQSPAHDGSLASPNPTPALHLQVVVAASRRWPTSRSARCAPTAARRTATARRESAASKGRTARPASTFSSMPRSRSWQLRPQQWPQAARRPRSSSPPQRRHRLHSARPFSDGSTSIRRRRLRHQPRRRLHRHLCSRRQRRNHTLTSMTSIHTNTSSNSSRQAWTWT